PLWKLITDIEPEQVVRAIDITYIEDAIAREEALDLLKERAACKDTRLQHLQQNGYPAYTTSAGWIGFSDDKIRHLCGEALAQGWTHFKLKVGGDPADDLRRARLVRAEIGSGNKLMMDANQKWDVLEAIQRTKELAELDPWWMEESTKTLPCFSWRQNLIFQSALTPGVSVYANACSTWRSLITFAYPRRWRIV